MKQDDNNSNNNNKVNETEFERAERLAKRQQNRAKKLPNETESEKVARLAKLQWNLNKIQAHETEFERENRLARRRQNTAKKLANETESERAERLAIRQQNRATKRINETELERTEQLKKHRKQKKKKQNLKHEKINYLAEFNVSNGLIYEQTWAKVNMNRFHELTRFSMKQCKVCFDTWPMKSIPVSDNFICVRCSREKKLPKRFSKENGMIPSAVPKELHGLTQTEEMLIA